MDDFQKFCPFCGGALAYLSPFCPHCGARLPNQTVHTTTYQQPTTPVEIPPEKRPGYIPLLSDYGNVLKNFARFSGRTRRKSFFFALIFNAILLGLLSCVSTAFQWLGLNDYAVSLGCIMFIYFLIGYIPTLALMARRLHDSGKSGFCILLSLIPAIGFFWLGILLTAPSAPENGQPIR